MFLSVCMFLSAYSYKQRLDRKTRPVDNFRWWFLSSFVIFIIVTNNVLWLNTKLIWQTFFLFLQQTNLNEILNIKETKQILCFKIKIYIILFSSIFVFIVFQMRVKIHNYFIYLSLFSFQIQKKKMMTNILKKFYWVSFSFFLYKLFLSQIFWWAIKFISQRLFCYFFLLQLFCEISI